MRKQDWDRASELYAQVHGAKPEEGAEGMAADAMFRRGQALMAAKKYPEAASAFAALLEQDGGGARAAEAQAQRAIALSRSGEHEGALASIDALAKLDSS